MSGPGSVLISTSTFPICRRDGSPQFVWDLASALTAHVKVYVLAPGSPLALDQEQWDSVQVERFTYCRPRRLQRLAYGGGMPVNLRDSLLARAQVLPFLWAQTRALRRIVRERQVRVVNTHWLIPQGLTAAWARARGRRFFHLLHVHAADVYFLANRSFGRPIARFVLRHTDATFADGSHVRDALDRLLGYRSSAILQPNGVHTRLFRPRVEETPPPDVGFSEGYLVFVGRFVEKKGVSYLLRALRKVREHRPGLGLVLIGYGPLETALRSEVRRLGLDEAVRFAGRQPHEVIVPYLHACQAVAVPSIVDRHGETEGMPTVVLEAMAAGCRVVACAVDGIPDVVRDGENGWLCREKDPEDLAEKLLLALAAPDGDAVQKAAIQTAQHYDWEEVAARYLEPMQQLL